MIKKAITRIEVLVMVIVFGGGAFLLFKFAIAYEEYGAPEQARRSACASNLSMIYKSMMIYSQDYRGEFPSIPLGRGHIVGEDKADRNLKPHAPDDPFKDFPPDANHSISQNLWLLVRGDFAQPEIFNCPSGPWAGQGPDRKADGPKGEYSNFVDFPWPNPATTISYSFIQPWSRFTDNHTIAELWQVDQDPRAVIGGEANNGQQPIVKGTAWPPTLEDTRKYLNSTNHRGRGGGFLYGDGHVAWSTTPYTGLNNDNIYTALPPDYTGNPGDTPGILSVRPRDPFNPKLKKPGSAKTDTIEWDTVLVPNEDAKLARWNRTP